MKLIAGLLAGTLRGAVPVSASGKLAARTSFGIAIRSTTAAQSIPIVAQTPEVALFGSFFSSYDTLLLLCRSLCYYMP